MCRLLAYFGTAEASLLDLFIRPSHSIIKQSYGARERLGDGLSGLPSLLNADGFGVAWYAPEESGDPTPGCYVSTSPAWNDANLPRLCAKLSSHLVLAHIRAASLGAAVTLPNCHPFISGRYALQHNGHIGCFAGLKRRILATLSDRALASVRGTTDSEHLFALFLTEVEAEEARLATTATSGVGPSALLAAATVRLAPAPAAKALDGGPAAPLPPEALQRCLVRTFQRLQRFRREAGVAANCLLNVCVTDGHTLLCTRVVLGEGAPASLYVTVGSEWLPATATSSLATMTAAGSVGSCAAASAAARPADGDETGASGGAGVASRHVYRRHKAGPANASSSADAAAGSGAPQAPSSTSSSSSSGIGCPGVAFEMRSRDVRPRCVIVASERLTAREEDWLTVPPASMLVIHRGAGSLAVTRIAMPPQLLDAEPLPLPMPLLSPSLYGTPAASEAAAPIPSIAGAAAPAAAARQPVEKLSLQPVPAGALSSDSGVGDAGAAAALAAFELGAAQLAGAKEAAGARSLRIGRDLQSAAATSAAFRPPVYLRKRRGPLPPAAAPAAATASADFGVDESADAGGDSSRPPPAKRPRASAPDAAVSDGELQADAAFAADDASPRAGSGSAVRAQLACLGRNLPSHLGAPTRSASLLSSIAAGSHDGGAAGADHDGEHHDHPAAACSDDAAGADSEAAGLGSGSGVAARRSKGEAQQSTTFRFSGADSLAKLLAGTDAARAQSQRSLLARRGAAIGRLDDSEDHHDDAVAAGFPFAAARLLPRADEQLGAGAEPSPAALLAQGRQLFSSTPQTLLSLPLPVPVPVTVSLK